MGEIGVNSLVLSSGAAGVQVREVDGFIVIMSRQALRASFFGVAISIPKVKCQNVRCKVEQPILRQAWRRRHSAISYS